MLLVTFAIRMYDARSKSFVELGERGFHVSDSAMDVLTRSTVRRPDTEDPELGPAFTFLDSLVASRAWSCVRCGSPADIEKQEQFRIRYLAPRPRLAISAVPTCGRPYCTFEGKRVLPEADGVAVPLWTFGPRNEAATDAGKDRKATVQVSLWLRTGKNERAITEFPTAVEVDGELVVSLATGVALHKAIVEATKTHVEAAARKMAPAMCCAACDHRVESGGALRGYLVLAPDLRRAVDFRHVVCPPSRNPKCEAASKQIMKRDTATLMDPKQLIKGARCAACDKASADPTREFSCCSRCKQARYCSKDCQVADWPKHKPVCSEIVAMKKDSEAKAGRK